MEKSNGHVTDDVTDVVTRQYA